MKINLTEIHNTIGGILSGNNVEINSIGIDTRTLESGACYIAIKGKNFDGNNFVHQAIQAGAKAAILQKKVVTKLPNIVVDNTHIALIKLAHVWRQKCGTKIIAVTGSNGKTTVKEMIAAILKLEKKVLSTQGNLNNAIGVPLTLLRLTKDHQFGVIEIGANHRGEIANLSHCVLPNIGVITNVGQAHLEGFGSIDNIAKEKAALYATLSTEGIAIVNADSSFYNYWKNIIGKSKHLSFGLSATADVTASNITSKIIDRHFFSEFIIKYRQEEILVKLALAGQHNVVNALAAVATGLVAGITLEKIKYGLESIRPISGRLQPLLGQHGGIVINDSYNANPDSLKVALDVLTSIPGKHWVVLGAFEEMNPNSAIIHKQIGEEIKLRGVTRLLAIGADAKNTVKAFGEGATFFTCKEDLIYFLRQQLTDKEVLLVKGSRMQHIEQISRAITTKEAE